MRKVKVFKKEYNTVEHKSYLKHVYDGVFHGFSTDYEEFEEGIGQYPVAIIETADGKVHIVPAEMIEFIDEGDSRNGI